MKQERTQASIEPIQYAASYRLAADEIRRAIELGIYLPGDRLPASRELARQLGISVATLREAVRGLIDQGLLEMRRGPKGGLVVLSGAARGGRARKALLAEIATILEFRCAVEPYAASLAAERRTDDELVALQAAYDEMVQELASSDTGTRTPSFNRADSAFHTTIAKMSRNNLLIEAIEDARGRLFATAAAGLRPISKRADVEHDAILNEIRRGRPEAAAKAMLRHLKATEADVKEMA